jgi:hypothetical protein
MRRLNVVACKGGHERKCGIKKKNVEQYKNPINTRTLRFRNERKKKARITTKTCNIADRSPTVIDATGIFMQ